MRILSFKRISASYLEVLLNGSKKSDKRKRPISHGPLPCLKELGLYQEELGFKKRFFEAFFKKLLDVQAKGIKLNLGLKKNLGYKIDEAALSFTIISEIDSKKITGLKDLYPLFNQISLSLNDCLKFINTAFCINLQISLIVYSPLDTPKTVIHQFSNFLLAMSMLLNGFFGINLLDPSARENPYFCQARAEFTGQQVNGFFEKNRLNDVYQKVRQGIGPLYIDLLQVRTQLFLIL